MCSDALKAAYAATTGFFDGVHKGHKYIIGDLLREAQAHGLSSAIITFRQHPRQVLQQDYIPKLLTGWQEREQMLRQSGADRVVMLDFTPAFARQTAGEFMAFLRNEYGVKRLVIGYDHRFGHNRAEGFDDYRRIGRALGVEVVAGKAYTENAVNISSSVIRRLLGEGDISLANEYLGYRYGFSGIVVRGRGEGRKLGFPTANMLIAAERLIPKRGVYGVEVSVEGHAERFMGMMNIGCRPTYGGTAETVEVNIFRFDEEIYGRRLSVSIICRLRDERKFASAEELKQQLTKDRTDILNIINR
ncbi:MAG: riboflavin biosynthesis protein RibF [Prevotella sp.]|nr:riboflavin biosynthesis protein RibF [Prevotella sp.]